MYRSVVEIQEVYRDIGGMLGRLLGFRVSGLPGQPKASNNMASCKGITS